jgi:hypothetical protein
VKRGGHAEASLEPGHLVAAAMHDNDATVVGRMSYRRRKARI